MSDYSVRAVYADLAASTVRRFEAFAILELTNFTKTYFAPFQIE